MKIKMMKYYRGKIKQSRVSISHSESHRREWQFFSLISTATQNITSEFQLFADKALERT
jgi:hypothetical protein